MADNFVANVGVGGKTFRSDEIVGIDWPYSKLAWGPDGTANEVDDAAGKRLPVFVAQMSALVAGTANIGDVDVLTLPALATGTNTIGAVNLAQYTPSAGRLPIELDAAALAALETITVAAVTAALPAGTNNIGDIDVLTVPAPLNVTGTGTEAAALRVTLASDSTGVISVDDNAGSLTIDGSVGITGALPAGANNIGDVDVATIAAGTTIESVGDQPHDAAWTIGNQPVMLGGFASAAAPADVSADADVAHLWCDRAGRLQIGDGGGSLTIDGSVSVTGALPAGTNNIGDVDVLSLPALATGDANVGRVKITDGTDVAQVTTTGAMTILSVDANGDSMAEEAENALRVCEIPNTVNGLSAYSLLSAAAVESAVIKASAGKVYAIQFFNSASSPRFVRLYNMTTAPATTDGASILWRGMIPGSAGAGGFVAEFPTGITFGTGIGIRVTGAVADTDATALVANEIIGNVQFK